MDEVKQIIVIRKDLKMRKGKIVAQGAHASMKVLMDKLSAHPVSLTGVYTGASRFVELSVVISQSSSLYKWLIGDFTKIVVGVDSLEELEKLETKAIKNNILTAKITDAGRTEFNGVPTITALAIGPDYNNIIDPITQHLNLI